MPKAVCPVCELDTRLRGSDCFIGTRLRCPECDALLEVTSERPLELEEAHGQSAVRDEELL